ncbi:hypothetical protein [Pectinatus frisingensis]|uniref:hypothetical protein n=1 Tax=Pectinatus frisingensis TaxID=865 RepID=UPI003D8044C3
MIKHIFSAQFEISLKFSTKINEISDYLFRKKETTDFFGNTPFISPDKNAFFLMKQ